MPRKRENTCKVSNNTIRSCDLNVPSFQRKFKNAHLALCIISLGLPSVINPHEMLETFRVFPHIFSFLSYSRPLPQHYLLFPDLENKENEPINEVTPEEEGSRGAIRVEGRGSHGKYFFCFMPVG